MTPKSNRLVGGLALAAAAASSVACCAALFEPHLVRTMAGPALVHTVPRRFGEPARVLRTGRVYQSATYLGARRMEPVFAYYRAFERAFDLRPGARSVLAVGGGGFSFPKLVAAHHPGVLIDVVEIDPAVIDLARRWFFLDEAVELARAGGGDLRVLCEDGRALLERGCGPYDVVVLDAFMGERPVRSLATAEALALVRRALVPGGVCEMNVVTRGGGSDVSFLRDVTATALTVFPQVKIVPATDEGRSGEDNYLVVASDDLLDLPDAIAYDVDFLGAVLHDA